MFLAPYYSRRDGMVAVSAHQASHFAKSVAGDFNPIHDEDARKFCVPGDLLFALVLQYYGIYNAMEFRFLGTVGDGVGLVFPDTARDQFEILNEKGKALLDVKVSGDNNTDPGLGESLTRAYVAFSGHNFPHILVPLMASQNVMINPARPLVMYESMSLELDTLDVTNASLHLADTSLAVDGKRGDVRLHFTVNDGDKTVGRGTKKLALGGLQPYDEALMADVVAGYEAKKASYGAVPQPG